MEGRTVGGQIVETGQRWHRLERRPRTQIENRLQGREAVQKGQVHSAGFGTEHGQGRRLVAGGSEDADVNGPRRRIEEPDHNLADAFAAQ